MDSLFGRKRRTRQGTGGEASYGLSSSSGANQSLAEVIGTSSGSGGPRMNIGPPSGNPHLSSGGNTLVS